jgi:acetyl-CoA carboxylase biotin carboxylase subunit
MPRQIDKVLIANRGEIAVRIMRACQEMNIATVAVFSDADRLALHVMQADEAYAVGPAPSRQSYLLQKKIIEIALHCNADAIHPGYGFLAENAGFARKVEDAGLVFVGPSPQAMQMMGDKTAARRQMRHAGVPVVPGTDGPVTEVTEAIDFARQVGYPVLLKAAAGGGGKGMRTVFKQSNMAEALHAARSEARSAFGDDRIYVEKYLTSPGERECSIQRRHQKLLEEAPSCAVTSALREKMGLAAIEAAKICGYTNAGTVEFMLDENSQYYFLEMNTRLQVEHPVTEMLTGIDLVKTQIEIAQGRPLPYQQEDIVFAGHAIECRINAEDPRNSFFPSAGRLLHWSQPAGPGVRVDSGFCQDNEVTLYYDSLLAKLIVWDRTRDQAIGRMKRALSEFRIQGIETSIAFHQAVMQNHRFLAGDFNTRFIEQEFSHFSGSLDIDDETAQAAFLGALLFETENNSASLPDRQPAKTAMTAWKLSGRKSGA